MQYNAVSERIKFKYFDYLKEAKGFSDKSLKTIEASILRCERLLDFPNLIDFDKEMAKKLKKKIKAQELSVDTACSSLYHFKNFMQWLKEQTGYKAKLNYCDIEYLTITRNDKNSLGYKRFIRYPSINQVIESVINMPSNTPKQKRDQAMIALIALTGVRDGVIPHLRLKHLDMREKFLIIEPKEVPVKCGNYHLANFLVQDERLLDIMQDYITTLISKYSFCNNDPLFPKIAHHKENHVFATGDYSLEFMRDSQIIVRVCKDALKHLPNSELYSPHTIRHTLISLGKELTQNPKEVKAWSQSIGHSNTTHMMDTYGQIDPVSQVDIINNVRSRYVPPQHSAL